MCWWIRWAVDGGDRDLSQRTGPRRRKTVVPAPDRIVQEAALRLGGWRLPGGLLEWVAERFQFTLRVVLRCDAQKGFKLLPRRWVVERTYAWLSHCRRLSTDYETLPETFVHLAMSRLMLNRLAA